MTRDSSGNATARQLPRSAGRTAFGHDPGGYDSARSGYPPELFAAIAAFGKCAGILEIGAGTGLATRGLLRLEPERLVAIEPDAALAQFLRRNLPDPRLDIRIHPFGDAPVAGPFDLVAVASAFHWMEPVASLRQIRSLLTPPGTLALWWNSYRQPGSGDAFTDAVAPLLADVALAPSETMQGHYSLDEAFHRRQLAENGFGDITFHTFRRQRIIDAATARALFASYSFVEALPQADRTRLLDRIGQLVERTFSNQCPNTVVTALYLARPQGLTAE